MANLISQAQQQQQQQQPEQGVAVGKKRKTFIVRKTKALVELAMDDVKATNTTGAATNPLAPVVATAPLAAAASKINPSAAVAPLAAAAASAGASATTTGAKSGVGTERKKSAASSSSSETDSEEEEPAPKKKVSIVRRTKAKTTGNGKSSGSSGSSAVIPVATTRAASVAAPTANKKMTLNDWMVEAKVLKQQATLHESMIAELKRDKEKLERQLAEAQRLMQEERQKQDKERRTHMQVLWDQNAASHRHVMNTNHDLATSQQATLDKMSTSIVAAQRDSIKMVYHNMKSTVPIWDTGNMVQYLNQTYQTPANAKPRLEYLNQVCDEWKSKTRNIPSTLLLETIGDQEASRVIELLDAERSTIETALARSTPTASNGSRARTSSAK